MTAATLSPDLEALVRDAKVYAALSGTFDPAALPSIETADEDTSVAVTSVLAAACDTNPDESDGWLLRTSVRHYLLDMLKQAGELEQAIERRREQGTDQETEDLLLALEDAPPFSVEAIADELQKPRSEASIRRIVVALDRAGTQPDLLQSARSALGELGRRKRRRLIEERGFFGRADEKQHLDAWFKQPQMDPPVKAAFLSGLPGIGKSALLEEMVRLLADEQGAVTVRLDFDRAGLDVLDILGLTMEVARQLGERLGENGKPLFAARLAAASQQVGEEQLTKARRTSFPFDLGLEIGAACSGRPVTLVLDTLEVLRARGVQHPGLLFAWIDELANFEMRPLRIIAAGRGDAFDGCKERVGLHIALEGLDDDASDQLLDRLSVAPSDRPAILRIADGNPLVLRLAAEVTAGFGAKALPRAKLEKEVAAAFLYRFLLSRIGDPLLHKLAYPGLVTRRISAPLLREVLPELLGLPPLSEQEALTAFDALASQHWLVMRDPLDPEFVIHRGDMRAVLLPLLYREQPDLCAKIDAAAVTWFGRRSDAPSQLDAAYHRLQLLRQRKARPLIASALAVRFDDDMLAELPPGGREIVLRARGSRTALYQGDASAPTPVDDTQLASELLNLLDRQDWAEGQYVVNQAVEAGGFDPRSQAADAVRAFYWRCGKWLLARRLLVERDRLGADDSDLAALPWPLALARLEMRAEFTPGRLTPILESPIAGQLMRDFSRQIASAARHGALAFRLAARNPDIVQGSEYAKDADPVAAALSQWGTAKGYVTRRALDVARERLSARGGIAMMVEEESAIGQLLASHSPYVLFAANLSTQSDYGWLTETAARSARALADAGALFVPPLAGTPAPFASSPFADICHLGLFAEWADSTGFLERDPNLRMIGNAAERWRRTVAGSWQYGRPPSDWRQRPLDAVIEARTQVAASSDGASPRRLDLWTDRHGAPAQLSQLQGRVSKSFRNAAQEQDPVGRAQRLLRWRVPSAFVPALVRSMPERKTIFLKPRSREAIMPDQNLTERLEAVRARMTPGIEAAIRSAAGDGSLPRPLREIIGVPAADALAADRAALESAMPVPALEAIVQRTGRPPLLIENDAVRMEPLVDFPAGTDVKLIALNPRIPSVGRVEFLNHRMSWGGTGWVVEKKNSAYLIVTNRHVAKLVASRTTNGTGVFMRSPAGPRYGARVDFREEALSPVNDGSRTIAVTEIAYLADDLAADMALLRVAASPFEITPLPLADEEAQTGDIIALIGYPAYDSRNDANDQARYFRDLYDVKRMAPGKVMQALSGQTTLTHDATTLGGNSGSPVFSLETGAVVGLHFSGEYGIQNTAVGVATIKKVLAGSTTSVPVSGAVEAAPDGHHDAAMFADRQGFDPAFLKEGAMETPWPALPDAILAGLAAPSDTPKEKFEIRYTHFGVKYSGADKLPIMTAVNIDGASSVRIKRANDKWFTDGRIKAELQLAAHNFADLEIDRGHMVRREDPNWGDQATASQANADTFHYVNAAAQHSRLNQGKSLWQGLENYILDSSRTFGFRACVFTGPVLGDEDNVIDGARVPEEFWKLVATLDETGTKLHATAYLLSQGQLIRKLMEDRSRVEAMEGVVLGEYRTFQIAIEDLAEATGYDFSAYVAADPLARPKGVEAADDGPRFLPIDDLGSIQL